MVDNEKVASGPKSYQKIPRVLYLVNKQDEDKTKQEIEANHKQIKLDILQVTEVELERIKNDPN